MTDRVNRAEMSEADARRLLSLPGADRVDALRTVLMSFRDDKWLAVTEAAELAGISVRSLQRELNSHGVAFSELVADVRRELATEMLEDTEVTVDSIASALGYSSTTNFTRAFRRWTGVKPSVYRANSLESRHGSQPRPESK